MGGRTSLEIKMGKGSNRRPSQVSAETFSDNWNTIFSNSIHECMIVHPATTNISEEISHYWSDNGKREARIIRTSRGFIVEVYEQSRFIKEIDVTSHSLRYAEDTAENWCHNSTLI